jgi:hypothetical protein
VRPQDADPSRRHEGLSRPENYDAIVSERVSYSLEETMAMVLNEAGATYPESAAFIAVNCSKARHSPILS